MLTALVTYLRKNFLVASFQVSLSCHEGWSYFFTPTLWPHLPLSPIKIHSILFSAGLYLKYTHVSFLRLRPPSPRVETVAIMLSTLCAACQVVGVTKQGKDAAAADTF